jgi:phosphonate transport system ATP-binding protein
MSPTSSEALRPAEIAGAPESGRAAARAVATNGVAARATPLFRLEGVHRRWGETRALEDISLSIREGERVLLAGPSGSGKTTLLRILAGVLRPSAGTVVVDGNDLLSLRSRDLRRHQARCGIVEQGALLVPQLDVHRNVLAGRLAHMPWHRILLSAMWRLERAPVRELLEAMSLGDRQWDLAGNLSGGEQQRVAIARALISSPAIILADEPTSSLDPTTAGDMSRLLIAQAREREATLIFSSHWISLVKDEVDRIVGIRHGKLVVDARPEDVTGEALDYLYKGTHERV